jgi:hypothetical protein
MEQTRIDYVSTKCKICGRLIMSTMKHPVCDRCEIKDDRCMAIGYNMKRCKKRKVKGQPYCSEHMPH